MASSPSPRSPEPPNPQGQDDDGERNRDLNRKLSFSSPPSGQFDSFREIFTESLHGFKAELIREIKVSVPALPQATTDHGEATTSDNAIALIKAKTKKEMKEARDDHHKKKMKNKQDDEIYDITSLMNRKIETINATREATKAKMKEEYERKVKEYDEKTDCQISQIKIQAKEKIALVDLKYSETTSTPVADGVKWSLDVAKRSAKKTTSNWFR